MIVFVLFAIKYLRNFKSAVIMDSRLIGNDNVTEFKLFDEDLSSAFEQHPNLICGMKNYPFDLDVLDIPLLPFSPTSHEFAPWLTSTLEEESPDDSDSDTMLKFFNQIVEENMEDKPSMFYDPLALRATEKSFYEVIGQEYPPSPHNQKIFGDRTSDSPDSLFDNSSEYASSSNTGSSSSDPQCIVDPGDYISSMEQKSDTLSSPSKQVSSQASSGTVTGFDGNVSVQPNTFGDMAVLKNIFSDSESILQFKRGLEEARKFLPTGNQLIIDLNKFELPQKTELDTPAAVVGETDPHLNLLKGRKHHHQEDADSDDAERISKQPANYVEDVELSEMLDRVLLSCDDNGYLAEMPGGADTVLHQTQLPNGSTRVKINEDRRETVDLRTLLISCAQSIASDDRRTAYEQLKQIRHHSSCAGDVNQRLANVFSHGLEARLAGTGTELYASLARKKITAAEKLKAYQVYLSACPFKKMSIFFANKMIESVASDASALHIVDFGILYGFQWPILIQSLSERPGGPPKLRITGIELPQPGFRPTERVEETGIRLQKYCDRFFVPFEYQAIAVQNWESIKIKDLKLASDEVLAVNCYFRFEKLLDETVVDNNPRDAVLNLILKMNPDIFVNAVSNGSYSSPFFATRFREALFHYSALFDMFDSTLSRENQRRMDFEQDFYGREVINIVSCEGAERVERPEIYKQWQSRHMRAGFKPLALKQEVMKKLKHKVKAGYHKDFLIDDDGNWMLQGWKGRVMCACSCWIPA